MTVKQPHAAVGQWRRAEAELAAGRFWQAHEALEALWRRATAPRARRRLRALVQLCAALHKPQQAHQRQPPADLSAGMARILARAAANWSPSGLAPLDDWFAATLAQAEAAAAAWTDAPPRIAPLPHLELPEAAVAALLREED